MSNIPSIWSSLVKDFVLVIASPQDPASEGYSRRVETMDEELKKGNPPLELVYIFPDSPRWRAVQTTYKTSLHLKLNGRNPFHHFIFFLFVMRARAIYLHSVFPLCRFLVRRCLSTTNVFRKSPLIWDVHGLVPEESLLEGKFNLAQRLENWERWIYRNSQWQIVVSERMAEHFRKKYPGHSTGRFLVLPIVNNFLDSSDFERSRKDPSESVKKTEPVTKKPRLVVYAGGSQVWQKPELLKEVVKKNSQLEFLLLTPDKDFFHKLFPKKDFPQLRIEFFQGEAYEKALKEASFGLILRDPSLINQVACPTKLFEYLKFGVVPVIASDELGDFKKLKTHFLNWEELGSVTDRPEEEWQKIREENRRVCRFLEEQAKKSLDALHEVALLPGVDRESSAQANKDVF